MEWGKDAGSDPESISVPGASARHSPGLNTQKSFEVWDSPPDIFEANLITFKCLDLFGFQLGESITENLAVIHPSSQILGLPTHPLPDSLSLPSGRQGGSAHFSSRERNPHWPRVWDVGWKWATTQILETAEGKGRGKKDWRGKDEGATVPQPGLSYVSSVISMDVTKEIQQALDFKRKEKGAPRIHFSESGPRELRGLASRGASASPPCHVAFPPRMVDAQRRGRQRPGSPGLWAAVTPTGAAPSPSILYSFNQGSRQGDTFLPFWNMELETQTWKGVCQDSGRWEILPPPRHLTPRGEAAMAFVVVQSLCSVDSAIPRTTACQTSLSFTVPQSLLKLVSIESVMPSNHLILCHPFSPCLQPFSSSGFFPKSLFFTSGGQSIGASVLLINIQDWFPLGLTGLISLLSKELSSLLQDHSSKALTLWLSTFFMLQLSHP